MSRAIIKTTMAITANLEADRIEEQGDMIKVYNGKNIVGLFDVGAVQFAYLSSGSGRRAIDVCEH